MGKSCIFVSDNTPVSEPNVLRICQRDDGDIELSVSVRHPQERGVSIRASGSRSKNYAKIIKFIEYLCNYTKKHDFIHNFLDKVVSWWTEVDSKALPLFTALYFKGFSIMPHICPKQVFLLFYILFIE